MALIYFYFYLLEALLVNASLHKAITQRDVASCTAVDNIINSCISPTSNFLSIDTKEWASCLCYSSTAWIPNVFDNAILTCENYLQTFDPAQYSTIEILENFGSRVGRVELQTAPSSAAATTTAPPYGAPTTAAINPESAGTACLAEADIITSCESATPGFSNLVPSQQASCMCYTGAVWNPNGFDGLVQTCGDFARTADTSDYKNMAPFEDFCTSIGNVRQGATATSDGFGILTTTTAVLGATHVTLSLSSVGFTIVAPKAITTTQATATRNAGTGLRPSEMVDCTGFAIFGCFTLSCFMVLLL
jgi:hypothetical protein